MFRTMPAFVGKRLFDRNDMQINLKPENTLNTIQKVCSSEISDLVDNYNEIFYIKN